MEQILISSKMQCMNGEGVMQNIVILYVRLKMHVDNSLCVSCYDLEEYGCTNFNMTNKNLDQNPGIARHGKEDWEIGIPLLRRHMQLPWQRHIA